MKHLKVVAAVIHHKGKILCAQKGTHKYDYLANKFEFPGGKVESNESNETAIIREIKEELNLSISTEKLLTTVNHRYEDFSIELTAFLCKTNSIDDLICKEHQAIVWSDLLNLKSLEWAAADIPIIEHLLSKKY